MRLNVQDVEDLAARGHPRQVDVLVIGSGYGAAVAAERLAQAGRSVWLLERGKDHPAGSFPSTTSEAPGEVRFERQSGSQVRSTGYEDALFDFRLGDRISALVANGVGGGSLINAGVAIVPPSVVFAQPQWPTPIRSRPGDLAPFMRRAFRGLQARTASAQRRGLGPPPASLAKADRLRSMARHHNREPRDDVSRATFHPVSLTIEFADRLTGTQASPCTGCGNCCSGCNQGAKLSLDRTYLRRALAHQHAALFARVTALWVERVDGGPRGWRVVCVRSSERERWSAACGALDKDLLFEVFADEVVVAGGVFGSIEFLLRSRAHGLWVSPRLGQGISANGDELGTAWGLHDPAGLVGRGEALKPPPAARVEAPGPTICAVLRFRPQPGGGGSFEDHTLVEDGTAPFAIATPVLQLARTLASLDDLTRISSWRPGPKGDPSSAPSSAVAHAMFLLGMGHDRSGGRARLDDPHHRLRLSWHGDTGPAGALHRKRMARVVEGQGPSARFVPGPAAGLLPESLLRHGLDDLAGVQSLRRWVTVHPLGGCAMADSAKDGVVNHLGQVFADESGEVHQGLYVLDGSIIPRSLGVNPFVTIVALAERSFALRRTSVSAGAAPTGAAA